MRYCPSCDLAGLAPYTIWTGGQYVDGGQYEQCENDGHTEDADRANGGHIRGVIGVYHNTYMEEKAYRILCGRVNCSNDEGELVVRCSDVECVCKSLFKLLVGALEREALLGTLAPNEWLKTFPKRTSELVAMSREKAAAVLVDELPVVLARIIVEYFI